MLQVDDVWRLALMTVLFGWMMPYSYKWIYSRRHVGIHLRRPRDATPRGAAAHA